jgi:hypothetical protein
MQNSTFNQRWANIQRQHPKPGLGCVSTKGWKLPKWAKQPTAEVVGTCIGPGHFVAGGHR